MSEDTPCATGARSTISGTPGVRAAPVGRKARPGSWPDDASSNTPTAAGAAHRRRAGCGGRTRVGLVEHLGHVVRHLLPHHEPTDVGLRHAFPELTLDGVGHVVGQALDLSELVEFHGGIREGTAAHVVGTPVRRSNRWSRLPHRCCAVQRGTAGRGPPSQGRAAPAGHRRLQRGETGGVAPGA